jgi:hypothetical protein
MSREVTTGETVALGRRGAVQAGSRPWPRQRVLRAVGIASILGAALSGCSERGATSDGGPRQGRVAITELTPAKNSDPQAIAKADAGERWNASGQGPLTDPMRSWAIRTMGPCQLSSWASKATWPQTAAWPRAMPLSTDRQRT